MVSSAGFPTHGRFLAHRRSARPLSNGARTSLSPVPRACVSGLPLHTTPDSTKRGRSRPRRRRDCGCVRVSRFELRDGRNARLSSTKHRVCDRASSLARSCGTGACGWTYDRLSPQADTVSRRRRHARRTIPKGRSRRPFRGSRRGGFVRPSPRGSVLVPEVWVSRIRLPNLGCRGPKAALAAAADAPLVAQC